MADELVIRCGAITLADGDPRVGGIVEDLKFAGQHLLAVSDLINAIAQAIRDRTTKSKEIQIRIFREHASYTAALNFAARHDEQLPGVAGLFIELTEDGETTTWISEDCGWEGVTQDPIGVSTVTEYRIVRGSLFEVETTGEGLPSVIRPGGFFSDGDVIDGGTFAELIP